MSDRLLMETKDKETIREQGERAPENTQNRRAKSEPTHPPNSSSYSILLERLPKFQDILFQMACILNSCNRWLLPILQENPSKLDEKKHVLLVFEVFRDLAMEGGIVASATSQKKKWKRKP